MPGLSASTLSGGRLVGVNAEVSSSDAVNVCRVGVTISAG